MRVAIEQSIILLTLANRQLRLSTVPCRCSALGKIPLIKTAMSLSSSSAPKCAPCSSLNDSAKLSVDEANAELAALTNPSSLWSLKESQEGILALSRKFTARNFQAALDAINEIGAIAEKESHHPDLHLTNYREVEIEIYTHKVNGLTQNDFILAAKINGEVTIDYSPKWLRENTNAFFTSKSKEENN
mmetsp:Transcript_8018/g.17255  ORF Transcript_8018/g.17255 Transcript_8018/m.17255 type:complete len:188 (-) Transcript_8018:2915-3478(-)